MSVIRRFGNAARAMIDASRRAGSAVNATSAAVAASASAPSREPS